MPLLLLPLLLFVGVALLVMLMPLSLWQRYRLGKARRRAVGWQIRLNAWLMLVSSGLFAASALVSGLWIPFAAPAALLGLTVGALLGKLGMVLTRVETDPSGRVHYTPNAVLVLALTGLLVVRLGLAMWQGLARIAWMPHPPEWMGPLGSHASLFGLAGVLLGYALVYAWALRTRLGRRGPPRL